MSVGKFDDVLQWARILMKNLEVNDLAGSLVCRPDCRVVSMCFTQGSLPGVKCGRGVLLTTQHF